MLCVMSSKALVTGRESRSKQKPTKEMKGIETVLKGPVTVFQSFSDSVAGSAAEKDKLRTRRSPRTTRDRGGWAH
jgi:hypothetical protein